MAAIAADTLRIVREEGLDRGLDSCLYEPGKLAKIEAACLVLPRGDGDPRTVFEVRDETSLQGARRLASQHRRVGVLNFASARNPGGGFLGGAYAQEESLARSSALYASLSRHPEFYRAHQGVDGMYSDRVIYTRRCPVLREDDGTELASRYLVDFVTCAAPNLRHCREPGRVGDVLLARSARVLAVALHEGCDALVLGAWGCGVFGNDPGVVASCFRRHLVEGPFRDRFAKVAFSVLDGTSSGRTIGPFRSLFPPR